MYFSWFILNGISLSFFLILLISLFFSRCKSTTRPLPAAHTAAAPSAVLARPVHHGVASHHQRTPGRVIVVLIIIIIIIKSSNSIDINIVIKSSMASSPPSFLYIYFFLKAFPSSYRRCFSS